MADSERGRLEQEGFLVWPGLVEPHIAQGLNERIEDAIDEWAAELDVARATYLDAVCRWSSPNRLVDDLARACSDVLAPIVRRLAGPGFLPRRSSVFRKSGAASLGTHGHQDAGYWARPTSSRYALTTWVALDPVDSARGALRVLPGSHLAEVGPAVDHLRPGFVDPADSWGDRAETICMQPGDALVFGPKLWHASHPIEGDRVRRSLAIRWLGPWPVDLAVPPPDGAEQFGMYTSGEFLQRALSVLAGREVPGGLLGVEWALDRGLVDALLEPIAARRALWLLRVHLQAVDRHHASDQRGMAWEAVREAIVRPALAMDER